MRSVVDNYRKYGVPISDLMDSEDLEKYWGEVDLQTRSKNASVTNKIQSVKASFQTESAQFSSYKGAKKALDTTEDTVIAGSAATLSIVQYPILKAQEATISTTLYESVKNSDTTKKDIF